MYKKLYLIIMAGTLCFSAVHGQSGYTGTFGGNVQGGEYINVQGSLGGDQVVGPSGDMELGGSAALDIYGALTVNQGAVLTLRNGAVLNLYGDMALNGSLVAEQGSTINFYGKSWTNGANAQVTNNGAVNGLPGNALYFTTPQPAVPSAWLTSTTQLSNYSGNVQGQIIDGGAVPMNIDVYLNNTNNVSLLNTNTKLAGRLIFNKSGSYLVVNNRKMIFTATGSHSGAATDRYIETNLSADAGGAVMKEDLAPGSPFSFPVGSTIPQDYTPAEITPAAGVADNYSVNVNTFSNSSTNMASFGTLANMQRVWQVYAEKNASAVTSSNIVFSHYQGLERNSYTPTQSDVWFLTDQGLWTHNFSCNTEDSTDLSGLRYYTRGLNSIALPACPTCATSLAGVFYTKSLCSNAATIAQVLAKAFVSFTASEAGCSNKLQWVVTGSNTNGNFDVERSIDGKNYTAVKKVPYVKGTTTYTTVDDNLEAATYYYRVKYSANGQEPFYTTAAMVKNSCPASKAIQIYPNPAVYSFTVNATGNSKVTSVDVLTSSGRLVKHVTNTAGNTITNINVSDLAAGLYLVRTTDANNVQVYKKLIIQNK